MIQAPQKSVVFLNGDFIPQQDAKISIFDRGFLFGDSVYEVIPVYQGVAFRLQQHLKRLRYSLDAIKLASPYTDQQWAEVINRLVRYHGDGNQSIYLQVTRGAGHARNHAIPKDTQPTVLLMSSPLTAPSLEHIEKPLTLTGICVDDFRWSHCDIKSTSLLANVMLYQEAQQAGVDEALLIRDNQLTEGAASNIFICKNQVVFTPPKSQYLLGGITRDLLIEIMAQHHIECRQEAISKQALFESDEIWVTSSAKELAPLTYLDGKAINNGQAGPLWKKVAEFYIAFKHELCGTKHT